MNCTFIKKDDLLLLKISGRLSGSNAKHLKRETLPQMTICDCQDLLCDLSRVEYLDNWGLEALLDIQKQIAERGGRVKLAEIPPRSRLVFDRTWAYKHFDIFDSIESAQKSFALKSE